MNTNPERETTGFRDLLESARFRAVQGFKNSRIIPAALVAIMAAVTLAAKDCSCEQSSSTAGGNKAQAAGNCLDESGQLDFEICGFPGAPEGGSEPDDEEVPLPKDFSTGAPPDMPDEEDLDDGDKTIPGQELEPIGAPANLEGMSPEELRELDEWIKERDRMLKDANGETGPDGGEPENSAPAEDEPALPGPGISDDEVVPT